MAGATQQAGHGWLMERVIQVANVLLVLTMPLAIWVGSTIIHHDRRLTRIEANRYTYQMGIEDREKIMAAIDALRLEIPPAWFKEKVDDISTRLASIERELSALKAKVK